MHQTIEAGVSSRDEDYLDCWLDYLQLPLSQGEVQIGLRSAGHRSGGQHQCKSNKGQVPLLHFPQRKDTLQDLSRRSPNRRLIDLGNNSQLRRYDNRVIPKIHPLLKVKQPVHLRLALQKRIEDIEINGFGVV